MKWVGERGAGLFFVFLKNGLFVIVKPSCTTGGRRCVVAVVLRDAL